MSNPGIPDDLVYLGRLPGYDDAPQPQAAAPSPAGNYDALIDEEARKNNIDPAHLRRMAQTESGMNPNAVSPRGAGGLLQLMPGTARDMGVTNVFDPNQNVAGGARYFRQLLTKYNEHYPTATAAYNWGMGNVDTLGLANAPRETRDYVDKTMGYGDLELIGALPGSPAAMAMRGGGQALGTMTALGDPSLGQPTDPTPLGAQGSMAFAPPPPDPLDDLEHIGQIDPSQVVNRDLERIGQIDPSMISPRGGEMEQGEELPWYSLSEVPGALKQGIIDATREAGQTASGQAFTDTPVNENMPRSFMGEAAYGMAHSYPMVAGGITGALGGAAVAPESGPIGPMVGGALGLGGVAAFQALKPGYDQGRAQNMSHEDAVTYAIRRAATEGVIGAATAPLFELSPFRSAIGKMLFTSFTTEPAVGAATRVISAGVTGDPAPTAGELVRGAGQDIVAGLTFGTGAHLAGKILPKKPEIPIKQKALAGNEGVMPPPPQAKTVTKEQMFAHASARLTELDEAAHGVHERVVDEQIVPATPSRILTDAEKHEREFLAEHAANPEALAAGYGVEIGEEAPRQRDITRTRPGDETQQHTTLEEDASDELVQTAGHAAANEKTATTGEKLASDVQPGREQEIAGDVRDQGGTLRIDPLHGSRISAEATSTGRDVPGAGLEAAGHPVKGTLVPSKTSARTDIKSAAKGAFDAGNTTPVTLKNGETIYLAHVEASRDDGTHDVTAYDKDGNEIGGLSYETQEETAGTRVNPSVEVDAQWQRKGVATKLYDFAEQNGALIPDVNQAGQMRSKEGQAFRRARAGIPPEQTRAATRTAQDDGTIRTDYEDAEGKHVGYSVHDPETRNINTIRVNEDVRRQGHGERILRDLVNSGAADKATAGSYEALKLNEKVGGKNEGGGNKFTFTPETMTVADQSTSSSVVPPKETVPGQEDLSQDNSDEMDGEIDTITAAKPQDQAFLDHVNEQLDYAERDPNPSASKQDQIERLTKTRDELLPGTTRELLAKKNLRPKKPISDAPPRALGAPKNFMDYKLANGTPIFRDAFVEHAKNVEKMADEDAALFADRATSMPLEDYVDARGIAQPGQITILKNQVQRKFAFPEVKIDPRLHPYEARNMLLDLHRAMADMMHSMNMPVDMASLQGKVTLQLGPLAKGRPFGSYVYGPGFKEITVNGRASVFGHEWVHAMDHDIVHTLFGINNPLQLATELGRLGNLDPNHPMTTRMGNLINALFHDDVDLAMKMLDLEVKAQETTAKGKPTFAALRAQKEIIKLRGGAETPTSIKPSQYFKTSDQMGGVKKYWTLEAELLARAGEAYIARNIEDAGLDPRGVVMPSEAYLSDNDDRLRLSFPKLQDRSRIFAALDHLMDGYRKTALAGSVAAAQAMRDGNSDPLVWGKLTRNPNKLGPLKELIFRLRNINDTLAKTKLTDPTRPDPGARTAWQRAKIAAMATFHSRMGLLEGLHEMMPPKAAAVLQKIMDRLGHTVGSGRYTGWDPIEERTIVLTKKAISQYANILHNNGFEPESFTTEQGDHLRHVMTTGEHTYPTDALNPHSARVPIDPRIIKVAGPLRSISDRFFQQMRNAGIKVGYAQNGHFLRIYDTVRAHSDPEGFTKAASTLHKLMFDKELGTPGASPDKLQEHWRSIGKAQQGTADPATQAGMAQLASTLRQLRKLERDIDKNGSTPAKDHELLRLQQEAEQLAADNHDGVGNHIARINADNWLMELRRGYADDWDKTGPGGNFLNKRTLPPEADQIMREFMITDPMTVLPRYYESAARKIAYAERFGANGEIKEQLLDQMIRAGAHSQDVAMVRSVIDSVSGKTSNDNNRGIQQAANVIHAGASLGMMARAPYSMMAEPFVIALSQGSMRAGLKSLLAQFSNVMRTSSARQRAELADWLGVTSNSMHDDVMMNRVGTDYSDSPMIGKFMSRFYRATWMTQWTNANRRAAMVGGDYMLTKWSRDILSGKNSDAADAARRVLNELGIAPELHMDFAAWKAKLDGMPSIDDVEGARFGQAYSRAMRRIIDRSVIDPKKIERPLATDDKWLGLLWQFQSFNYGFQRNVLDPMLRKWGHAYDRGYERGMDANQGKMVAMLRGGGNAAWQVGHVGAIAASYVGINILTSALRQYIFNQDDWQKHEEAGDLEDYLVDLAMSRSGLSGTLDPLIQVGTNLRYNQDLSSLLQGPGVKWYAKNAYDVFSAFANPSGEQSGSNLRAHEGVKGMYNLIGTPVAGFIATKLSAFGPLGVLAAGAADQYVTAPQFANQVATAITGPKGTTLDQGGAEGELSGLGDEGFAKLGGLEEPGGAEGGGTEGISDAQGAGAVPWGIMDDFIAPAWKAAKPLAAAIPGPLKAAVAAGTTAYYGKETWDKYEPYREQAPSE